MAVERDSLGRIKRKCKARFNPMSRFRKDEFLARYRLSKRLVRRIVSKYKRFSSTKGLRNGGGLSHENRFCLALRYFATGGNFLLCGDTQHVSIALVSRAVQDVSDFFYDHASDYIQWPSTTEQRADIALQFYQHKDQGKPRVMGIVDGTHISLGRPRVNESCYVNRHNYHSINTTVICDQKRRILYIDPRFSGSVGDAYALHSSPVGDLIRQAEDDPHLQGPLGDFFLLADAGYGVKPNVFTPYRTPANPQQVAYNKWHRHNRVRVEQCIGVLKQRWRCLDSSGGYLNHSPLRTAKIIYTCACLHNIALDHGLQITSHPNDPWVAQRDRLPQPPQRRQSEQQVKDAIKRVRDDYVTRYF